MSYWKTIEEKPNKGNTVVAIHYHSKRQGWKSVEMLCGEVEFWGDGIFGVWNNDDRGNGSEYWRSGEDFTHWCYVTDMPDLPED